MRYPRIAGIEFVGEVESSSVPGFRPGQMVLVHGFQTGIALDGGFSPVARVPAAHVHALPEGLTPREAAALGVPAFTAAMALSRFEAVGLVPASGTVAVTGAGGAVGLTGMAMPRARGLEGGLID